MVLLAKDPNATDPNVTCAFTIVKDPTWKKVYLDIRSFSTVVSGVIDGGLPSGLVLRTIELSGMLDPKNGLPTKNLAVAKPKNISGHIIAADIAAYSASY